MPTNPIYVDEDLLLVRNATRHINDALKAGARIEDFATELSWIRQLYAQLEQAIDEAYIQDVISGNARLLNLRRRYWKRKRLPFRRVLMRRVPREARFLGKLKRGVRERKSAWKAETARRNGRCPVRPGNRPRGRPRKGAAQLLAAQHERR